MASRLTKTMERIMVENLDSLSDEELIKLIGSKYQKEMMSILYDRYEQKIYFKCISMLKNETDARDLTHDIFIKIFTKLGQFKSRSRLSLWIHSISVHSCLDFLAKNKKMKNIFEQEDEESLNTMDDGDELLEEKKLKEMRLDDLEYLIGKLKEDQRIILIMKYSDGFTIKEISETIGLGESAIKMKLKRTREKLHDLLTSDVSI